MAIQILLFLLPATAAMCLIASLQYVAYPLPDPQWIQLLFDLGMLLTLAGILAAWRLSLGYLARDGRVLQQTAPIWKALLAAATLIGILCTGIAVEQFSSGGHPRVRIGFTLLAPAALLLPISVHLWWHGRERKPPMNSSE